MPRVNRPNQSSNRQASPHLTMSPSRPQRSGGQNSRASPLRMHASPQHAHSKHSSPQHSYHPHMHRDSDSMSSERSSSLNRESSSLHSVNSNRHTDRHSDHNSDNNNTRHLSPSHSHQVSCCRGYKVSLVLIYIRFKQKQCIIFNAHYSLFFFFTSYRLFVITKIILDKINTTCLKCLVTLQCCRHITVPVLC